MYYTASRGSLQGVFAKKRNNLSVIASQCHCPGCGSQRLLRCRSHPCWLRPQQLLPVSAAGGGRRRCSRRERHWRVGQAHAGRVKLNLYRKQQYPATRVSSSLTRNMVPQLLPSVAGHYFFALYQASGGQLRVDRPAKGSPSGRAGAERLRGQGRCQTALALRSYRSDKEPAYRCAAALRFSFILCRTTSRQARCTSAVSIQLTG